MVRVAWVVPHIPQSLPGSLPRLESLDGWQAGKRRKSLRVPCDAFHENLVRWCPLHSNSSGLKGHVRKTETEQRSCPDGSSVGLWIPPDAPAVRYRGKKKKRDSSEDERKDHVYTHLQPPAVADAALLWLSSSPGHWGQIQTSAT
eukprot:GHVT01077797.1.p2 GENE.GHVT01077797.1~~GHVT01077797.1.p2  ORF type:complete len:145 (+),score=18.23 GHVT01077797.1:891-1325(+)